MRVKRNLFCALSLLLLASACAHHHESAAAPVAKGNAGLLAMSSRTNEWTDDWTPLFDGKSLTNWAVTDFGGQGPVIVESGQIEISMGAEMSGITWTNGSLPKTDYEIALKTKRIDGDDFFCGLTFPVGNSSCSLILGGWGGAVVGLSSVDGDDASENQTSRTMTFKNNQWYHVRVRVTPAKIEAWLDDEKIVDLALAGHTIDLRPGPIFLSAPLGVATYQTSAAIGEFKLRRIEH